MLEGVDVVAFFSLKPGAAPVAGSPDLAYTLETGDVVEGQTFSQTFWFSTAENLARFAADPGAYAPRFGGFCSFGISMEMSTDAHVGMDEAPPTTGWKWSREYLGPPADTSNWVIRNGKLYFTFLPDVMDAFLADYEANAAAGEDRWADWFGDSGAGLQNGPFNTDCMASGYGPPVTRTCTWLPQDSGLVDPKSRGSLVDSGCAEALEASCGHVQGNNPVADNECSTCLSENYDDLRDACPSTATAISSGIDKAFCW